MSMRAAKADDQEKSLQAIELIEGAAYLFAGLSRRLLTRWRVTDALAGAGVATILRTRSSLMIVSSRIDSTDVRQASATEDNGDANQPAPR